MEDFGRHSRAERFSPLEKTTIFENVAFTEQRRGTYFVLEDTLYLFFKLDPSALIFDGKNGVFRAFFFPVLREVIKGDIGRRMGLIPIVKGIKKAAAEKRAA